MNSSDGMQRLRSEAGNAPFLSPEEEAKLVRQVATGSNSALDRLLRAHIRLVMSMANELMSSAACAKDELVSEGLLALVEAARRFDPERGTRFAAYAAWWIRAYMRRYSLLNRRMVRAPSTRAARVLLSNMPKLERRYLRDTGRKPDAETVAKTFGVDVEAVREVEAAVASHDVCCASGAIGSLELSSEQPSPEALVVQADAERATRERVQCALGQLSSREREVVEKRHLDEQPHTLSEIGRDLGVSRERIRQLELRARDKLKRMLEVA
ncbi:MAG TPA: sigma-70 family RNA polymerase sigma factor [Polyangiales bacterium]|nr:sigma-70 family RNA polymerase sigma factor [Polyangiales bacterium]